MKKIHWMYVNKVDGFENESKEKREKRDEN